MPNHFTSWFLTKRFESQFLILLSCLLRDTASLELPVQVGPSLPYLGMGPGTHSGVSTGPCPSPMLHTQDYNCLLSCVFPNPYALLKVLALSIVTSKHQCSVTFCQRVHAWNWEKEPTRPSLTEFRKGCGSIQIPWTGLLSLVWIKSNTPFLLSDEKGRTAYSLRAFFKEHRHHLLWALTPDLKGLAEVVALSERNLCRSSCFPNNTGLLLAGWQAI